MKLLPRRKNKQKQTEKHLTTLVGQPKYLGSGGSKFQARNKTAIKQKSKMDVVVTEGN